MKEMKIRFGLALGILTLGGWAFGGTVSDAMFLTIRPEASSFWHTALSRTIELPIEFPAGASSASLVVKGSKSTKTYAGITGTTFTLTLPEAADLAHEDVYELTLTFDDGTVQTAKLGLLAGVATGSAGSTRCYTDETMAGWARAFPHGVIPVPYGTTALTVNGTAVEEGAAGFTGAQGWYALPDVTTGTTLPVALTVDGETTEKTLTVRDQGGLAVFVR